MPATSRQVRRLPVKQSELTAAPDKLAETREMVAAQQVSIKNLSDGQARIETEVKEMRVENTQQHADNGKALGAIGQRLNLMIGGGFVALLSLLGGLSIYLVQSDGGPWVSKARYEMEHAAEHRLVP